MGVLPDHWIEHMATARRMIEPFARGRRTPGRISSGVSSYGYDFRLAGDFKVPVMEGAKVLDPKKIDSLRFRDLRGRSCTIAAGSFVLGRSLEYFRIPRDVLAVCQGKSTYARCGLVVNVTPLEPEWEGFLTVALVNGGPLPLKVHAGEGVAQLLFLRAESDCRVSYADRGGKYQGQQRIQPARV
jgi:dCTP deaminase